MLWSGKLDKVDMEWFNYWRLNILSLAFIYIFISILFLYYLTTDR